MDQDIQVRIIGLEGERMFCGRGFLEMKRVSWKWSEGELNRKVIDELNWKLKKKFLNY